MRIFSHPRFLVVYSGVLTAAFIFTIGLDIARYSSSPVLGAEKQQLSSPSFDQITVHRINIVEPDGIPRLVISDKAEYPGGFYMGKELSRPDRSGAGMLFMNDEGTENGGMMFGGAKAPNGTYHSYGHLSFDGYEQDQSMSLDADQDGDMRATSYQINDNIGDSLLTPTFIAALHAVRAMPEGPEKQKAVADFKAKYHYALRPRASMGREPDRSAVLRLRDPEGHTRILLRVAADGTPTMQFLDASGKVISQWPDGHLAQSK